MNWLLYCTIAAAPEDATISLPWAGDASLQIVEAAGLAAVVGAEGHAVTTGERPRNSPQPVQHLLAYGDVIEALHRRHTLIPMRYGCRFESRAAVLRYLCDENKSHKALLTQLHGRTEMSIRAIFPEHRARPKQATAATFEAAAASAPGLAYLELRRRKYKWERQWRGSVDAATHALQRQFQGLFKYCRTETADLDGRPAPRLHFLVDRESVPAFRLAFNRIATVSTEPELRLSGPWPPYNYVHREAGICAHKRDIQNFCR